VTDVFLERHFDPPIHRAAVLDGAAAMADALRRRQVHWLGSLLTANGHEVLCGFRGPDVEAVRAALAAAEVDVATCWIGTIHGSSDPPDPDPAATLVLVGRRFDEPVTMESIQAIEFANRGYLESRQVRFLRSYFSEDQRRMLCLYQAPDAESVRVTQLQAGMPFDTVSPVEWVDSPDSESPAD
jgi:Protein of unknown function (DUF4242)